MESKVDLQPLATVLREYMGMDPKVVEEEAAREPGYSASKGIEARAEAAFKSIVSALGMEVSDERMLVDFPVAEGFDVDPLTMMQPSDLAKSNLVPVVETEVERIATALNKSPDEVSAVVWGTIEGAVGWGIA